MTNELTYITGLDCFDQALMEIKKAKLNHIRCALTGAPYATVDDSEIQMSINTDVDGGEWDVDALVESWKLRALVLNSHTSPILLNVKTGALRKMRDSKNGYAKAATYFLSRLFFPTMNNARGAIVSSSRSMERMLFAIRLFDTISESGEEHTLEEDELLTALAAGDSYHKLSQWQTMPAWKNRKSPVGCYEKKYRHIATWFANPDSFVPNKDNLKLIRSWVLSVIVTLAGREGLDTTHGNDLALDLFEAKSDAVPVPQPTQTKAKSTKQKEAQAQADFEQAEWYKTLNKASQTKYAWSVTHGKGTVMGGRGKSKPTNKSATPKKKVYKDAKANEMANLFSGGSLGGLDFT